LEAGGLEEQGATGSNIASPLLASKNETCGMKAADRTCSFQRRLILLQSNNVFVQTKFHQSTGQNYFV